jgi:hypothetical protein
MPVESIDCIVYVDKIEAPSLKIRLENHGVILRRVGAWRFGSKFKLFQVQRKAMGKKDRAFHDSHFRVTSKALKADYLYSFPPKIFSGSIRK